MIRGEMIVGRNDTGAELHGNRVDPRVKITFTTVGSDPFNGQTRGPRPPLFLQADPKLAAKQREATKNK
jgi:hypothetical protein